MYNIYKRIFTDFAFIELLLAYVQYLQTNIYRFCVHRIILNYVQ